MIRVILFTCIGIGFGVVLYANLTYDPVNDRTRPLDPGAVCRNPSVFPADWSKDCP